MRVLVVTNLYPTSRSPFSGTFVEQQVQGLRRIGIEIDVLFVNRVEKGMKVYWELPRAVQSKLVSFNPNIVHVMYGGLMAEMVSYLVSPQPMIVSFCGTDLLGGSFFSFLRWVTVRMGVLASQLAAKRANGIIVKSENLVHALPKTIDLKKVWIIPNGIDLDRFHPLNKAEARRQLGWTERAYHIVVPGYPGHIRKRHDLAQSAVERLRNDGMEIELHLLFEVSHSEVPLWLNASNVLLLTSIHEGSPNIVKEALACNSPVVSTDVGDVRERIQGIQGCYLTLPDSQDISEKLRLAIRGSSRVQGRIEMQDLSLENVARKLNDVYRSVLDRQHTHCHVPEEARPLFDKSVGFHR